MAEAVFFFPSEHIALERVSVYKAPRTSLACFHEQLNTYSSSTAGRLCSRRTKGSARIGCSITEVTTKNVLIDYLANYEPNEDSAQAVNKKTQPNVASVGLTSGGLLCKS